MVDIEGKARQNIMGELCEHNYIEDEGMCFYHKLRITYIPIYVRIRPSMAKFV